MSQASEIDSRRELIATQEICELAMCPHAYLKQAIWWTRLAAALDLLAEEVLTANLKIVGSQMAADMPHLADQALSLDAMGSEALDAIQSTRETVTRLAGESHEAMWVRDSVKWVLKRIQLINFLVEDLAMADCCRWLTSSGTSRLHLVSSRPQSTGGTDQ
ncbi:MAG: hypothetical protein PHN51_10880 [Candidatus Nanopelagicales bacterium]|nr:hypothetical protein [Candidatus Nanopelagicales bacterium]